MKPIIRVEGLSKQYRIGTKQASYVTLRESLTDVVSAPFRRLRRASHQPPATDHPDTIWALKDVSFEVQPGEVVGIIGRNGAGKSTLLKILSRITEPTEGRVDLYGRVGSLLEVGTGFHAELTGRENIYLNGAILGMKHREIAQHFDEIVAFAEIEKFLDTPVKHYSSGMYMRLAFAVAAHLEPEILVVDEVLAVGDLAFQKKCMGKMNEVAKNGKTIIFVSHNMDSIAKLCSQGFWLQDGALLQTGHTSEVVKRYYSEITMLDAVAEVKISADRKHVSPCHFSMVTVVGAANRPTVKLSFGEPFHVKVIIESLISLQRVVVGIEVSDAGGNSLFTTHSNDYQSEQHQLVKGKNIFECNISANFLMPGRYCLTLGLVDSNWSTLDYTKNVFSFEILDVAYYENALLPRRPGRLLIPYQWALRS